MAFTAFDLFFMLKELQFLIAAKVDKVYQEQDHLLIAFHKGGKYLLKATPFAFFLTQKKFEPKTPSPFCMFLRKRLGQARLVALEQLGFERIVRLTFHKQDIHHLIIELFSKGNIILCDKDNTILAALHTQQWRHRLIKAKELYQLPPAQKSPFDLTMTDFLNLKMEVVKILATKFGLGGKYAEEVCALARVSKEKACLSHDEQQRILRSIHTVKQHTLQPGIQGQEAVPFPFRSLADSFIPAASFSEALEHLPEPPQPNKTRQKLEGVMQRQQGMMKELEADIEENRLKGDLIYKNYSYVKELLEAISKAREKGLAWKEIEDKLKTKNIHLRNKRVEVELD